MGYFNPEFTRFLKELAANNNKEWFDANRKTYEKEVKKPFAEFVAEMIDRINEHDPEVQIKPGDAIMRINKDIRFSKDKTPYNTHVAANISAYGKKDKSYPGIYFQLSPENIMVFGGAYMVDTSTLQQIREYIASHTNEFAAAYNNKDFKEKYGTIQGEQHKRVPKEFQEIYIREPLIANKQFYYSAELSPDLIQSDDLPDHMLEYYLAGKSMNEFLKKAMRK